MALFIVLIFYGIGGQQAVVVHNGKRLLPIMEGVRNTRGVVSALPTLGERVEALRYRLPVSSLIR